MSMVRTKMVATTRPGQWRRLGLPKLMREPTDSDKEPIVNPLPIAGIAAETGSMAEASLRTSSPQVTNTYQR